MGIMQSHPDTVEKPQQLVCNDVDRKEVENLVTDSFAESLLEEMITEDLLIEILSYVPDRDLIFNCRLVCKEWKSIIDAQSVWRLKCEREHVKLPTPKLPELPKHHYRHIYFFATEKTKNLVKNPCGEDKLNGWKFMSAGFTHFAIEDPPAGADPVPAVVGSQSCFATTYTRCQKYQVINLSENPVHRYLLQNDLVTIKVGEWYAARFDCGSYYELKVILYDDQKGVIDKFEFSYTEEQWTGREWHLVTHEFMNVKDVCFVEFHHMGVDKQYWAGHYGSKMTGAFVELCLK